MQSKRRDGLLCAIFSTLTCGLYGIYFWYTYGNDVNEICAEDGKQTPNYIVAWVLSLVTCGIYGLYWIYCVASRLDTASKKYDVNVESPVFFTVFMMIPFLSYFYSCDVMNKFQEKYEKMYPNGMNGNGYQRTVPPTSSMNGDARSFGAQFTSQFKSVVQDVGNGIKNTAQDLGSGLKNTAQDFGNNVKTARQETQETQVPVKTCKNCGAPVQQGKNYCKRCGYPVNGPEEKVEETVTQEVVVPPSAPVMEVPPVVETPQMVVCPNCGKQAKPGDRFCIHCGSKIE